MRDVSEIAVAMLQTDCGLDADTCRAALKASGGDLVQALFALKKQAAAKGKRPAPGAPSPAPVPPPATPAPTRIKPPDPTVEVPPLPRLTLRGDWEGRDVLPFWKGYQSRGGAYTSQDSDEPSTGEVEVVVMAVTKGPDARPFDAQIAAYRYLKQHQDEIGSAIIAAIFQAYPKMRESWDLAPDDDMDGTMPVLTSPDQFENLIGLGTIFILDVEKDGAAYVGFEMGCTWDDEHGLGVMTHQGRIVEVGQADMAFRKWTATRDGGKQLGF